MEQMHGYSLADIDQLLPLTNKIQMLKWLKEQYLKAQDAMEYGFEGATVLQNGDFVATAEEISQLIDVKRGRIGQLGAQLLINMFYSGVIPDSLTIHGKEVHPEFYHFAFPDSFSNQA
jgi:hypothetical protein